MQRDRALSDVDFCASDVGFHTKIAEATCNPLLALVVSALLESLQPITNVIVFRFRDRARIVSQHERLLVAIERRDEEEADKVLAEQMEYLRKKYREARTWRQQRDRERLAATPERQGPESRPPNNGTVTVR